MIIRVSEAHVMPTRVDEFVEQLHALVADFPTRYNGLLSHEILIDINDPSLIQYISRWTDQTALIAYAGENWAHDPVTFPNEDRYLAAPLILRHFDASPLATTTNTEQRRVNEIDRLTRLSARSETHPGASGAS